MDKKSKGNRFIKTVSNILNYFVVPLFFVGAFSVMIIFFSSPQTKIPHVFGHSVVRINSSSMVEKGFNVGDVVFVNQNKVENLKKGDIVAFYKFEDAYDRQEYSYNTSENTLVKYEDFDKELLVLEVPYKNTTRITPSQLQKTDIVIHFHYIEEVFVSPDGIIFYQTKGSNPNASPDGYIRQDFIVAKYTFTPLIVKAFLSFIITPAGMISLVVFPLCIIAGYESFRIFKKLNAFLFESKVFKRTIRYDDPALKHYDVSSVMSSPRKAYFWLTSKKEEKDSVFAFLYSVNEKSSKKSVKERDTALVASKVFNEKGALEFFRFWHNSCENWLDKKEVLSLKFKYEETIKNARNAINNK